MSHVVAVCTSEFTGTCKQARSEASLEQGFGLLGDAHADRHTHRQVSLLSMESISKMQEMGVGVAPGDFGENLTTAGIDLATLGIGTRIYIGDTIVLEITQIGKECHKPCAIYKKAGTCVMPTEGIFARVIRGGNVKPSDPISLSDK